MSTVRLTRNQYGKAENHVVRLERRTDRHSLVDLNVTSQLRGDLAAAHLEGDNGHVVPTDTQKNTIFAFAREPIDSPERFLLTLADQSVTAALLSWRANRVMIDDVVRARRLAADLADGIPRHQGAHLLERFQQTCAQWIGPDSLQDDGGSRDGQRGNQRECRR